MSLKHLPQSVADEVAALLTPESLVIFGGVVTILGACHFSPAAPACALGELFLAGLLLAALGTEAYTITRTLYELSQQFA